MRVSNRKRIESAGEPMNFTRLTQGQRGIKEMPMQLKMPKQNNKTNRTNTNYNQKYYKKGKIKKN